MRKLLLVSAVLLVAAAPPAKPKTPSEIVAEAPAGAWRDIAADDLLVMDLRNGARVVIQLAPQFAPVHVANIRALAKGGWWSGSAIYRVQDNYVVQWGNNESTKPLPAGVVAKPPAEYHRALKGLAVRPLGYADAYAPERGFRRGLADRVRREGGHREPRPLLRLRRRRPRPVARHRHGRRALRRDRPRAAAPGPQHRGRRARDRGDRPAELACRAGRKRSASTRKRASTCRSRRCGWRSEIPAGERPAFQYMDTQSATFGAYVKARANRKDDFFIRPAGGVDLCNAAVPVRKKPA